MTSVRTNQVTNPSFEVGTAGWAPARATIVRAAHPAAIPAGLRAGAYCGQVTALGTGIGFVQLDASVQLPVVPGVAFQASATAYSVTGQAAVGVLFYNAGGGYAGKSWAVSTTTAAQLTVTAIVPETAVTARVGLRVYSASGGHPANTDVAYFDRVTTALGTYFDGSTAAHDNVAYRWVGTANASASEEYYALPTVLAEELPPSPAPSVGITVVALGTGTTVYNLWRVAAGQRVKVRGGGDREAVEADYVEDYEIPPNIPVTYELEILSGPGVTLQTYSATIQVYSATGWLQDPLAPGSAIPIDGYAREDGAPVLMSPSLSELLYESNVSYMQVLGSSTPVALIGQRAQANGVALNLVTKAAEHSNDLRDLVLTSGPLLLRPIAPWGDTLPPLCYIAPGTVRELPRHSRTGVPGTSDWEAVSPLIKAPSMDVLVPRWTWGDVEALYSTWNQAETVLSNLTWLDVTKDPTGA